MPLNIPEHVSSLETISNSIRYDPQVSRWFLLLVDQRSVRTEVLKTFPEEGHSYRLLALIPSLEFLLGALSLAVAALAWQTKNYFWLTALLPVPYPAWKLVVERRILIARISEKLLTLEFPGETLAQKTLYQISEILSRAFALPSLVDTIYHWDYVLRVGTITFWVIATLIFPLKLWPFFMALGLNMLLLKTLLRARFIYRRFR